MATTPVFLPREPQRLRGLVGCHLWRGTAHPYVTTGKTIALTRRDFVGKVMSLLFNMLSRFSSKEQASFNFMAAVTICSDLEPKKIKSVIVSVVSPSIWHEVIGPDTMIFMF